MKHSYTIYTLLHSIQSCTVHSIAITLLLMCSITIQAQHEISGSITDSSGFPVNGAVVMCTDTMGQILSHDVSNKEGKYELIADQNTIAELSVTHLSYEEIHTTLQLIGTATIWDCVLKGSNTVFDEIMIVADYKKKDTVQFSMENLNLKESDNLKNILEKIPNFLVGEDGVILYEGKSINKIMVNNQVAFINQNTTALNSIQANMIENLDVIHNYQNNFEIDFDEIFETVININTKESVKNIFSGLVAAEIGTSKTYNLSGDLMKFSKGLSIIATHNTNTIGKKDMDQREIQSLFRPETSFSYYQENLLQNLFEEREDFTSNLFSHSTATVRKRNSKLKLDGTLYRINNSLSQSSIFDIQDLDQQFFSENKSIEDITGNSYLSHGSIAYKLSPKSIISYDIFANKLKGSDNSTVIADQYNAFIDSTKRNVLHGMRSISSSLIDQSVSYHNKISTKNILFAKGRMATESSQYKGTNEVNDLPFLEDNEYQYENQLAQYDLGIKSKFSDLLISSLSINYTAESEVINITNLNENFNRSKTKSGVSWKAWGDINRKFEYKISTSLHSEKHILSDGKPLSFLYAPVSIILDYQRRKHGWLFRMKKNYQSNKIEHSFNIMEPLQYNYGSIDNITALNISENWVAQYTYNDIFEGELLSLRLFRNKYQNDNTLFFIENVAGVSAFRWFNFKENSNLGFRINASKVIMPLKFPTKIDVRMNFKNSILPLSESYNMNRKYYDASLTFKTVTNRKINYSLHSQFVKLVDRNLYSVQNYIFLANNFSISYYHNKWDCVLHVLQENHWINGALRNRWNINSNLSYSIGKYTISMDIRHLGELLTLIDNDTYNYTYSQEGGLVYRSQRDQSLKYIILGLKYIF